MDVLHFETLRIEVERLGIRRALIVTSLLRGLHGSPLVALDVGRVLAGAGVEVAFLTLNLGDPLRDLLADRGFTCFDPLSRPRGVAGESFDLVWAQHWPAYGFALLELAVQVRYLALVSLSSFEPLESIQLLTAEADLLAFNAPSTRDQLLPFLDADPSTPMGITHNGLPPDWFSGPARPIPARRPRSIAFVSNRDCEELRQAAARLAAPDLQVRVIGSGGETCLVDRAVVDAFDVIVTIGHTVQKALARGRAVYCYDRFGGPGYITAKTVEQAERHNFSGRDQPVSRTPDQICADLIKGYRAAAAAADALRQRAAQRYRLDLTLAAFLKPLNADAEPRRIARHPLSAERKLVRYAVNHAVGYALFTPDSALSPGTGQCFVRAQRTVCPCADILFCGEGNEDAPTFFAVSRQPRPVALAGVLMPVEGVEVIAVTADHGDGRVTTAAINGPSPELLHRFPQHPRAGSSRFDITILLDASSGPITLHAALSNGTHHAFLRVGVEHLDPGVGTMAPRSG